MSKTREHLLKIIEQRQRDEALKDIDPEVLKVVQENMNVPNASQAETAPEANQNRDRMVPANKHQFEVLVDDYMVRYSISKVDALRRVMIEHPHTHRAYIADANSGKF
jgi:hypothetical protein